MSAPLASPPPDVSSRERLRAIISVPVADVSKQDLRLIGRFFLVLGVVVAAMGVQLVTRMAVRHASVELDATRSAVAAAQIENDRLLLERSMLRSPERVRNAAAELSLTAPVAILELPDTP